MKLLWMMLCAFTFLLSEGMSQKLIVSTDKHRKIAQDNLLKLKVYFIENPKIRALNEGNHFILELETLGAYNMVVVKPIKSMSVKNTLLMEIHPLFPDIFAIEDKTRHQSPEVFISDTNSNVVISSVRSFMETIGLQWVAIFILSTVGLILSISRRKKLFVLEEKQKKLYTDQQNIEEEIIELGKYNA